MIAVTVEACPSWPVVTVSCVKVVGESSDVDVMGEEAEEGVLVSDDEMGESTRRQQAQEVVLLLGMNLPVDEGSERENELETGVGSGTLEMKAMT